MSARLAGAAFVLAYVAAFVGWVVVCHALR